MKICVLGLGYVGLTLSLMLAENNLIVTGIDTKKETVELLTKGKSPISENGIDELLTKHIGKNLQVYEQIPKNEHFDVFIVCVGTPLDNKGSPIVDYVIHASNEVGSNIKKNGMIILRSTVPVGTTRNIVKPIIEEKSGLKSGIDFNLIFAPERTIEGAAISELRNNPQVIGSLTEDGLSLASKLFERMTKTIVPVSSIETAEMIKLIDNSYRDVHFAFSNELAVICELSKLDVHECISKANFMYSRNTIPLPSPGVGGPCLSKDSIILSHVAKQIGYDPKLLIHSRWINDYMPTFLAQKISRKLNELNKNPNKLKIFIIGFAFKGIPETDDIRNSPTLLLLDSLQKNYSTLYGYDPVVSSKEIEKLGVVFEDIENGFKNADCVIFMNNNLSYSSLNLKDLLKTTTKPCLFVDCWNMFREDIKKYLEIEKGIVYTSVGLD